MLLAIFLVIVPVFLEVSMETKAPCQFREDPRYRGVMVDCKNLDLKYIPNDFPSNTTSIDLSGNGIDIVKNYSFDMVSNLQSLDLKNNTITNLEANAFHGCNGLKHLDLSKNKLKLAKSSYPDSVFDMLHNLRWLNMKQNEQGNGGMYPERIFKELQNLRTLRIDAFDEPKFGEGLTDLHNLKELVLGDFAKVCPVKGCQMITLTNNTFLPLSNLSLDMLDISYCSVNVFETGVFAPLKKLTKLVMPYVPVGLKNVMRSLSSFADRKMSILDLCKVHLPSNLYNYASLEDAILKRNDLKQLRNVCVEKINLAINDILFIDALSLRESKFSNCVTYMDLSYNSFVGNSLGYIAFLMGLPNLKYIDGSYVNHALAYLNSHAFRRDDDDHYQHYEEAIYSQNNLQNMFASNRSKASPWNRHNITLFFPRHLRFANFSAADPSVGALKPQITIINGHNLLQLNFSFLGLTEIYTRVQGLENMRVLDLSGNPNMKLSDSVFDSFPALEILHMSHYSLQQGAILRQGKRLLQPFSKLKILHINNNRLSLLPENIFDANPLLQFIDLSNNIFTSIPFDLRTLPQLQVLDLTLNTLGFLDKVSLRKIDSHREKKGPQFQLLLNGNIFLCGCGSLDFLYWLKTTRIHLDKGANYTCLLENGEISNTAYELIDIKHLWKKCIGPPLFYFSFSFITWMLATLLSVLLVKTNKTTLVNMFMGILRNEIPTPRRADYRRDVYISYAEADYQWVCHRLYPELENRNLSMFIWDRDSVPGDSIPDQIAETIPQCWKILLYFTDSFEKDPWMYISMMTAINSVDNAHPDRIILLLPEEEHPRIPNCLLEVVPESCIIRIPSCYADEIEMWDSISTMVRREQ